MTQFTSCRVFALAYTTRDLRRPTKPKPTPMSTFVKILLSTGLRMQDWEYGRKGGAECLVKTLNLIAECEDGENEPLKDYQKKMVRTLARCFPVYKFEVSQNSRDSLVISEYLKANCTLANLDLVGDLDELTLAIFKIVLQSDHKLVHLYLLGNLHYNFLQSLIADPHQVSRAYMDIGMMQMLGAKALAVLLHSNSTLTHLNIRWSWIIDPGALALAHVLQFNCTLTHLNLHSALIWDPGAIALAGALLSNCTLDTFESPGNWITDIGAEAFGTGLESNVTLTYLDLHQPIGCGDRTWPFLDSINYDVQIELIGELGASALARALRTNSTLTYLDLQENAIGSSGAVALGEALQSNHTLTHLYLSGNEIGDSGADALAKALQPRFNFTQLNPLQQSYTDDSGVAELHFNLVKALQTNGTHRTQLTRLDLSLNKISSSGAIALADALQSNCTLARLDLSFNQIECSGAAALAKALQSNRTLTHLSLRSNIIGDSGATKFAETLQYNDTLTFLDLTGNPVGELGAANLSHVVQSICTLKYDNPAERRGVS
ncbi:hypothetical protein OS493_005895 [Desmophyllum pertusum]|uniref:Uncharacterized protein n=1 Tax=Desmophyllum pertusum TaxID=174260 RepID=A0A9W9YFL1_9CNID|nr:hypothetical protein OS493_005895 [Desmophyllum pertusum]